MYFGIIKAYWKDAMAYRVDFLASILIVPFRFLIMLMIWSAVFLNAKGTVAGYSLESLITYFIITSFISIFIYDFIDRDLENEIKSGNFLVFMLMPFSFAKLGFLKKVAGRSFSLITEIIPLLVIFLLFFRSYFQMGHIFLFTISLFFAFILSYLIFLLIGTVAFWFVNIRSFSWFIQFGIQLSSGIFVPLDMFPSLFQKIFSYLPFQYITFVPASIYLGKYSPEMFANFTHSAIFSILMQFLWCIALFAIAKFVWHKAQKHFSGVGA